MGTLENWREIHSLVSQKPRAPDENPKDNVCSVLNSECDASVFGAVIGTTFAGQRAYRAGDEESQSFLG